MNVNITAGTDIVSFTGTSDVLSLNFTGFSGTLANTTIRSFQDVTFSSGMTLSAGTNTFTFAGSTGTKTITTNGKTLDFPVTFNSTILGGAGTAVFTLADNMTVGSTRTLTLSAGTLSLNSKTLSCGLFSSSGGSARNLNFTGGTVNITGNNATIVNMATVTNLSFTGTAVMNCTYSGSTGTRTFAINSTTSNLLSVNITAGSDTIAGTSPIFDSLNFTGFTGSFNTSSSVFIYGDLIFGSGMNCVSGTNCLMIATSGTKTLRSNGATLNGGMTLYSNFPSSGTATFQLFDNYTSSSFINFSSGTLDLNNKVMTGDSFQSSIANTRTMAFGTSGQITVTGSNSTVWDTKNITGLTITGTNPIVNATYAGSTGTRTIDLGTLNEANSISLNVTAGTDSITDTSAVTSYRNLNFTGFAGTFSNNDRTVYGNLIFSSGMTLSSGTDVLVFAATSGAKTITTNGKTLDFPVLFNGAGGTWQLQDNFTLGSTRTMTLTAGTFAGNNKNVSSGAITPTSGTLQMGNGTWSLTGAGTVWTASAGVTIVPNSSTISFDSASDQTFNSGGKTYFNLAKTTGSTTIIAGNSSYNTLTNSVVPSGIKFNFNQNFSFNSLNLSGTPGNLITISSTIPGIRCNLISLIPNTFNNFNYVSFQDCAASGGANWNAFNADGGLISNHNINAGNNLGFDYIPPGATLGAFS